MVRSVRLRLTLWYSGLLAVVLVTFSAVSYVRIARAIRLETDASLADTAREFTAAFTRSGFEQRGEARDVSLDFRYSDRALVVLSPDGRILVSSRLDALNASDRAEISARVARGVRGFFTLLPADHAAGIRALAVPVVVVSNQFVAVVARSLHDQNSRLTDAGAALFLGIPLALLVTGAGGYLLARHSFAPVLRMSRKTQEIGASSLGERIEVRNPHDELGVLATTINGLLARLEAAFTSQRRFMAEASHELRTPLSILQGEADVALSRRDRRAEEYREALEIVQKTCRKLTQIVEDLFLLSRGDVGNYPVRPSRFYLDETVSECARAMRTPAESRGIGIEIEPLPELIVFGDEELIHRLVLNLLDNAVKYTRRGGIVRVALSKGEARHAIIVRDEGPGVAAGDRDRIFERFYRGGAARPGSGGGAGLGLAIAKTIARLHGGDVRLAVSSPEGSTFIAEIRAAVPGSD